MFLRERIFPWKVGSPRQSAPISLHLVTVTTVSINDLQFGTWSSCLPIFVFFQIHKDNAFFVVLGEFWRKNASVLSFSFWESFFSSISPLQETIIHANSFQYKSIIYQDQDTLSVSDKIQSSPVCQCKVGYFISSQNHKHLPRHSEKIV